MNTHTVVRVNVTIPTDIIEDVKRMDANVSISKFASEAMSEKLARQKRERALNAILAGPPTFTDIEDSTAYVRALRDEDRERDTRLKLL